MKKPNLEFNKKFPTSFIFLLLCVININAQSYAVFNASSTPGVNGIYIEDGTFNSVTKYTNGDYVMFYANQNMKWAIVSEGTDLNANDVANSPYLYSNPLDMTNPPQKGWHHGGNTTGLPGEYIIVTLLNSIGCNKECLVESLSDDGTIKDTALFYLYADGITFAGINGDDFILDNKIQITNVPSGLTAKAIRKSDSILAVFFDGSANNHTMKDNTDSLILILKNEALSNSDISTIINDSIGLTIMYQNPYCVAGISSSPDVNGIYKLEGLFNLKPYYRYKNYYLMVKGCYPRWIIRAQSNVHPMFSTQIDNSFPHNRQWHNGGFFYIIKDDINIAMQNSIHYEKYSFVESFEDNGEFIDSLKIQYYHPDNSSSFSGDIGDDLVADGKIIISNLPEGLSMEIRKSNDTILYTKLKGQEINHDLENNINNLIVEFTQSAFNGSGIFATNNLVRDSVNIVHMSKYIVVDTTNFQKASNGLYYSFDLINNKPAYYNQNDYYLIRRSDPPGCCVWSVLKKGQQNAVYRTEEASESPPENNWIIGDWDGTSTARIEVFPKQSWLSYSNLRFSESTEHMGMIPDTCLVILNCADDVIFNGSVGEDFFASGKATIYNVPEGLMPILTKVNDTCIHFILSDTAILHQVANNVNNMIVEFYSNAFNTSTQEIKYTKKYNFSVSFNNLSDLKFSSCEEQAVILYPNPADNLIFISFQGSVNKVFYELYEITGKKIKQGRLESDMIDISGINKGFYILHLRTDKGLISKKIVIE